MIEVLGIKVGFDLSTHPSGDAMYTCQCGWALIQGGRESRESDVLLHHMNCHASQRAVRMKGRPTTKTTVGERLRGAIAKSDDVSSVKAFQGVISERGVRGAGYASIHRYLRGKVSPTVEFLAVAAEILGVREAWLTSGDGFRTEAEHQAEVDAVG